MSKFKYLQLNRDKIESAIAEFSDTNSVKIKTNPNGSQNISFQKEGEKGLITLYFNKNSSTTISYKVGPNPNLSLSLAKAIKHDCLISKRKVFNLTVPNITKQELLELLDFLSKNHTIKIIKQNEDRDKLFIKIKSENDEYITFTLYQTSNLSIQGKPIVLAFDMLSWFSVKNLFTEKDYLNAQNKIFGIITTIKEAKSEAQTTYPQVYAFADTPMKRMLTTAVTVLTSQTEFEDPSIIAFPALRALEAFIKASIFKTTNIACNNLGRIFSFNQHDSKFYLDQSLTQQIDNASCCHGLEECYNMYHKERHRLFHADSLPGMSRIPTRSDAARIAKNALEKIESVCCSLSEVQYETI